MRSRACRRVRRRCREVLDDLLAGQHGLGDVIEHGAPRTIARQPIAIHRGNRGRQRARWGDCDRCPIPCDRGHARSIERQTASANSEVDAVPPRSRVRTCPAARTRRSAVMMRVGRRPFVDVPQHQHRRQQQRGRVRDVLPGDVRRAAVHRFEDADLGAQVRGADDAETADEAGAQIRHDVAVQVRHHEHVELRRGSSRGACTPRRRSSRRTSMSGKRAGDGAHALEKQAVAELHDVRLVDGRDLLAAVTSGVVEGELARSASTRAR